MEITIKIEKINIENLEADLSLKIKIVDIMINTEDTVVGLLLIIILNLV